MQDIKNVWVSVMCDYGFLHERVVFIIFIILSDKAYNFLLAVI